MKITKFKNKSKLLITSFFLLLASFAVFTNTANADWLSKQEGLDTIGKTAYEESGAPADVRVIAANLIAAVLGLLGMIFVIIVVIGGFKWMFAGGNAESMTIARKYITNGAIGLLITLSAFAITIFFTRSIIGAAEKNTTVTYTPIQIIKKI